MSDIRRSSAELAQEVELKRSELSLRLDALRDQFSARKIVDEAANRTGLGDDTLPETLSRQPLALAAVGAGIGWLIYKTSAGPAAPSSRSRPKRIRPMNNPRNLPVTSKRSTWRDTAIGRTFDNDPLIIGLGAVLAGIAIGAALPSTRREDELLGELHDDAVEGVKKRARKARHDAADAVKDTLRTAREAMQDEGLAPASAHGGPTVAEKVETVAERTGAAIERKAGLR